MGKPGNFYPVRVFRLLYTGYGFVVFAILFFFFLPFFFIPILLRNQFRLTGIINRWWARLLFTCIGVPFMVRTHFEIDRKKQYVFCPNHTSYLDIPTLGLNPFNAIFVGKNDIEKIPLFGFMYRKLHITVDRAKLMSRYSTLIQSREALDMGKSLVIFPEGGIVSQSPPTMASFKDGAFRLAIEKQIPIVPVTIPYNWIILPDLELILRWHPLKVVFHSPIETSGLTLDELDTLKKKVFDIIDDELKRHKKNEN
jgi:1-acyl-sn-glycerol-3-phosphate acyltransferase